MRLLWLCHSPLLNGKRMISTGLHVDSQAKHCAAAILHSSFDLLVHPVVLECFLPWPAMAVLQLDAPALDTVLQAQQQEQAEVEQPVLHLFCKDGSRGWAKVAAAGKGGLQCPIKGLAARLAQVWPASQPGVECRPRRGVGWGGGPRLALLAAL